MNPESIGGVDYRKTKDAAEQTIKDFEALRHDIAELTHTVSDLVQHQAQLARSQATEAYDTAKSKFAQSAADAQDKVVSLETEFESRIERNPLTALAIAMGVGVVVGMMSHPRR
ncbi:Membrane-anchored ribosome-binding protein, inhibits growth in stationary phase, ElaB/YqjD/DUF883 family [Rhizobiales bacterium GAS113]|nr:Membrane-anchored ribosome-binding protein, inhibits growth in stationary phase, ElaB/YqjD/DUF883 family [Rhizobiales bacterium GAS113]